MLMVVTRFILSTLSTSENTLLENDNMLLLVLQECALLTDGRFSGGSHGFVVGHICPEAQVSLSPSFSLFVHWLRTDKINLIDPYPSSGIYFLCTKKINATGS